MIWYRNGRPFPPKSRSWTTTNSHYNDKHDGSFSATKTYDGSSIPGSGNRNVKLIQDGSPSISTYANVTIPSLSRNDVQTELTCQASNFEATVLRTSVEIDMKCK